MTQNLNFNSLNHILCDNNIFEKKILNQNIYYKYLIRQKINLKTDETYIIENGATLTFLLNFSRKKIKKKLILGHVLKVKDFIFSSILNENICFEAPFISKILLYKNNIINTVKIIFKQILESKQQIFFFSFLSPTKKGYFIYFSGFSGFLPKKQFKYFNFKKTLLNHSFFLFYKYTNPISLHIKKIQIKKNRKKLQLVFLQKNYFRITFFLKKVEEKYE